MTETCEFCISVSIVHPCTSLINTATPVIMPIASFLACRNVGEISSLVVVLGWLDVTEKEIDYLSPDHILNHGQ